MTNLLPSLSFRGVERSLSVEEGHCAGEGPGDVAGGEDCCCAAANTPSGSEDGAAFSV